MLPKGFFHAAALRLQNDVFFIELDYRLEKATETVSTLKNTSTVNRSIVNRRKVWHLVDCHNWMEGGERT